MEKIEHVLVTGLGVSGPPVVAALIKRGARVTVFEENRSDSVAKKAEEVQALGATVHLGDYVIEPDLSLVITSPGWRPGHWLLKSAIERDIEIIGDVEFAWRLDQERSQHEGTSAPIWLALTGTNGKTTAVGMLASILKASGRRSAAVGNVGYSLVEAVLAEPRYEVLAVELSSFQLHWSSSIHPHAGAIINIAQDHIDWHGSFDAYRADKEKLLLLSEMAIVNQDDLESATCAKAHPHRIGVTRDIPRKNELGVVEDFLVDRAMSDPAVELATFDDITPLLPHNVTNALIASALARSIGVQPEAIAHGLRSYRSDGHRLATISTIDGVTFIDDSKATNPHAALAALMSYRNVIWIAGGLAKGAEMDQLVQSAAGRIKGAILIGQDRELIAQALERHAPEVLIERVDPSETGSVGASVMKSAVAAARRLAAPGDVVLLAPACASMDQFSSYAERGNLFIEAVMS